MTGMPGRTAARVVALGALSLWVVACSTSNNNKATPAPSATTAAVASATRPAAPGGSPTATPRPATAVAPSAASGTAAVASGTAGPVTLAACAAATRPPAQPSPTPTATSTPDPQTLASAQKLAPALVQVADLPPALRDFQPSGIFPITTRDYVPPTTPGADCFRQVLDQSGRVGGVSASFGKQGTYMAGQHTPVSFSNVCSEFSTEDGAKQGLSFVFALVNVPQPASPGGDQVSTSPVDPGPIGDESRGARVDTNLTVSATGSSGTPAFVRIRQSFMIVAWRHGKVVCSLQSSSIDEDPSLSDLQALGRLQDGRLTTAGF